MNTYTPLKIVILFILVLPVFPSPSVNIAAGASSGSDPALKQTDRYIIKGIELLYDWEFEQAEKIFVQIIAKRPEDPIGYFYLAMVPWSRLEFGFWSPETIKAYRERIERAVSIARRKVRRGKADSFTYFYLGGALGFKGQFQLMEKKWISSFFLALDAIDALKTCRKMDPHNRDVLFGLGIYDYYAAKLSGVSKFLTYLLIHRGNKEEGLKKLHLAAEEAVYSTIEAKGLLLRIYLFMEPLSHKARPLAEELVMRFKKNARFKYFQGVTYIRLGMDSEYREVLDFLRDRAREETASQKAPMWGNRAHYLEATHHLFHDQYHQARSKLNLILAQTDPSSDPAMYTWPLLKIGMSHDLEGERDKALEYYNRIIKMKDCGEARILAEKYIKKAIEAKNPFLGY